MRVNNLDDEIILSSKFDKTSNSMTANTVSKKKALTPQEKLYQAFKKHGIKRNNDAILSVREILGDELQKTTLEEVRKNAWRIR